MNFGAPLFSVVGVSADGSRAVLAQSDTYQEAKCRARVIAGKRMGIRSAVVTMGGEVLFEAIAWRPSVHAAIHSLREGASI